MQQIEKIARIRLIRSNKIGPVTFSTLLKRFGSAVDVIAAMPEIIKRSGINTKIISAAEVEDEIAKVERLSGQIFAKGEEGYPEIFMNYLDTLAVSQHLAIPIYWKKTASQLWGRAMRRPMPASLPKCWPNN